LLNEPPGGAVPGKPEFPGFLEFGTAHASVGVSLGDEPKHQTGDQTMFANRFDRFAAAAFSLFATAAFLAYAIVPASPSLMA